MRRRRQAILLYLVMLLGLWVLGIDGLPLPLR